MAKPVMSGVAGLLLAVLFADAALTNEEPPLISTPFVAGSTSLGFAPISSAPILHRDRKPRIFQPLKPGDYQTRPCAIILVAPESEHDDCCVVGATSGNSKMPVVNPELRAVPIPPSK